MRIVITRSRPDRAASSDVVISAVFCWAILINDSYNMSLTTGYTEFTGYGTPH